jgi:2,3-bisphosphoglycerate-independent phosphoglycerate mutase
MKPCLPIPVKLASCRIRDRAFPKGIFVLKKLSAFPGVEGPVLIVVMDGYGVSEIPDGNAVLAARKPTLDRLATQCPNILLCAHGRAVGMPSDDDMGNSEVGHNAIGSGQVYRQGAALVASAIASGALWEGAAWKEIVAGARRGTLHFIGLFSDGNVHSHIDHLKAMIARAKSEGLERVRVHILLDGRDVPETSALDYVESFERFLSALNGAGFDAKIASGGGRMTITMDRYEANWGMVEKGWRTHVLGEGARFSSAAEAIRAYRAAKPGVIDQDLPAFVVADGETGGPAGTIDDGDSVVFFNFRGDRAIEISRAFEEANFDRFERVRFPRIVYAGMLQYDGDLKLPKRFLVPPPAIRDTMSEWFSRSGLAQFACSETQKFGHVTYFWNGNRSGRFEGETWREIPSDTVPFEQRPWMKAAEIADAVIEALTCGKYRFLRCNFANGDMVGHTGNFRAATMAIEAVDLSLSRILSALDVVGGVALVTADHGNADEMFELDKRTRKPLRHANGSNKARTAHTLNPVPLFLYGGGRLGLKRLPGAGLSNIAATVANLLGFEKHPAWDESLLTEQPCLVSRSMRLPGGIIFQKSVHDR